MLRTLSVIAVLIVFVSVQRANAQNYNPTIPTAPTPTKPNELVRGHPYNISQVAVCTSADAVEQFRILKQNGELVTFPDGCGVMDLTSFVPDFKLPNVSVPSRIFKFTPNGAWSCTDNRTGEVKPCDVKIIMSGFIVGSVLRESDGKYVRVYVQMSDDYVVVDPPP